MSYRALKSALPYLAIIVIAGLLGFSITRVDAGAAEHQFGFTLGGVLVAAVAISIVRALSGPTHRITPKFPKQNLLGLKVGFIGFCIALSGWLITVLINGVAGIALIAVGIAAGFIGMAIHFALMLRSNG